MGLTLITLFDSPSRNRISKALSAVDEPLCKVPFARVADRIAADTLPMHFTVSAWKSSERERVLKALSRLELYPIELQVSGIGVMRGKEHSQVLYFEITPSEALTALQREVCELLPNPRYAPDDFKFHMTICIDQDNRKIRRIRDLLETQFEPFSLTVSALGLYEIYPAKQVFRIDVK